ncbi:MAG: hypothetical protein ACR2KQ_02990 [Actinomycetota bacterium]
MNPPQELMDVPRLNDDLSRYMNRSTNSRSTEDEPPTLIDAEELVGGSDFP